MKKLSKKFKVLLIIFFALILLCINMACYASNSDYVIEPTYFDGQDQASISQNVMMISTLIKMIGIIVPIIIIALPIINFFLAKKKINNDEISEEEKKAKLKK